MSVQMINLEFGITKQQVIQGTKNYVCSEQYMEKMVKISIMNILYQRLPVPDIFCSKEFRSVPYVAVRNEYIDAPIIQLYRKWIRGFLDSFRQKYLEKLELFFLNDETNEIEENYVFKFDYGKNINVEKACTDLTEPTLCLLRNLMSLGEIPKLDGRKLSLHCELFYCRGTPIKYKPKHFVEKELSNTLRYKMESTMFDEPMTFARILTKFHYFKGTYYKKSTNPQLSIESGSKPLLKSGRNEKRGLAHTSDEQGTSKKSKPADLSEPISPVPSLTPRDFEDGDGESDNAPSDINEDHANTQRSNKSKKKRLSQTFSKKSTPKKSKDADLSEPISPVPSLTPRDFEDGDGESDAAPNDIIEDHANTQRSNQSKNKRLSQSKKSTLKKSKPADLSEPISPVPSLTPRDLEDSMKYMEKIIESDKYDTAPNDIIEEDHANTQRSNQSKNKRLSQTLSKKSTLKKSKPADLSEPITPVPSSTPRDLEDSVKYMEKIIESDKFDAAPNDIIEEDHANTQRSNQSKKKRLSQTFSKKSTPKKSKPAILSEPISPVPSLTPRDLEDSVKYMEKIIESDKFDTAPNDIIEEDHVETPLLNRSTKKLLSQTASKKGTPNRSVDPSEPVSPRIFKDVDPQDYIVKNKVFEFKEFDNACSDIIEDENYENTQNSVPYQSVSSAKAGCSKENRLSPVTPCISEDGDPQNYIQYKMLDFENDKTDFAHSDAEKSVGEIHDNSQFLEEPELESLLMPKYKKKHLSQTLAQIESAVTPKTKNESDTCDSKTKKNDPKILEKNIFETEDIFETAPSELSEPVTVDISYPEYRFPNDEDIDLIVESTK